MIEGFDPFNLMAWVKIDLRSLISIFQHDSNPTRDI
jgi:hypothetical protein